MKCPAVQGKQIKYRSRVSDVIRLCNFYATLWKTVCVKIRQRKGPDQQMTSLLLIAPISSRERTKGDGPASCARNIFINGSDRIVHRLYIFYQFFFIFLFDLCNYCIISKCDAKYQSFQISQ